MKGMEACMSGGIGNSGPYVVLFKEISCRTMDIRYDPRRVRPCVYILVRVSDMLFRSDRKFPASETPCF
jgi:hypothetical protein